MFKNIKKLIIFTIILAGIGLAMNFVLAEAVDVGMEFGAKTGLSDTDPREVVANIIRIVLAFLGIIAVVLIMYAGFLWMTAGGNEEKIGTAKKILTNAVIGLVIILSSFAIASFVLSGLLDATNGNNSSNNNNNNNGFTTQTSSETSCDGNLLTPDTCDIDDSLCDEGYFCSEETCTCKAGGGEGDACSSKTDVCDVDQSKCSNDFTCGSDCICHKKSLLGEACNATTTPDVCEIDQSKCSADLTCSEDDCLCTDLPIIKNITPQGRFCSNNKEKSCLKDDDCNQGTCNPIQPNTAIGNIITISGRYFGDELGEVFFYDGTGTTIAGISPKTVNDECDSNWQDDQILIVVPQGVKAGPVLIERADGKQDITDNSQGPLVKDLIINSIKKPGLCKINPDSGYLNDTINYYGINFSTTEGKVKIGNSTSYTEGKNTIFKSATTTQSNIPNIQTGKTTSFVTSKNTESNYLKFEKLKEEEKPAFIIDFEPKTGAISQYITITGSGFGKIKGDNEVYFGDETGIQADYNFPDVCADSIWSDKQIIIKVPEDAKDKGYIITLVIDDNIINTSALAKSFFTVSSTLELAPSLCKINPIMGQIKNPITLWGEYFGERDQYSKVQFSPNEKVGQSNTGLTWKIGNTDMSGLDVYEVSLSEIPENVKTGPVRIIKNSEQLTGNGINLEIGNCLEADVPDDACGAANKCCPKDTFKSGRCDVNLEACNDTGIQTSVYEWEFSTSFGTSSIADDKGSCVEMSKKEGLCQIINCPNSAGSCSFYDEAKNTTPSGEVCSFECDFKECAYTKGEDTNKCKYSRALDRCFDEDVQTNCSHISTTTKDFYDKIVPAFCDIYKKKPSRVFFVGNNQSCPTGWKKDMGVSTSTEGSFICAKEDTDCQICKEGFTCMDDNDSNNAIGTCVIDKDICAGDGYCDKNKCVSLDSENCDCCCRIALVDEDCCDTLSCAGECGSDKNEDKNTYGNCSGCLRLDGVDNVDQAASDLACNCSIASGKFCDTTVDVNGDGILDETDGICRDCAQLTTDSCSSHITTCCVDSMDNNKCTSGKGNKTLGLTTPSVGYCEYYECSNDNTVCEKDNPVATPNKDNKYFRDVDICNDECKSLSPLGMSCAAQEANECNTKICTGPFGCINFDGSDPYPTESDNTCGTCCCDPKATTTIEGEDVLFNQCATINPKLSCTANKAPCDGDERGLCCGCDENIDCGDKILIGCGMDGCCKARPTASSTIPEAGAIDVCTNAEIRVEFKQKMSVDSFSSNIIVVGEYNGVCPENTQYLAMAGDGYEDKNALTRAFYKVVNIFKVKTRKLWGNNVIASDPNNLMNYCAITGTISSEQRTASSEQSEDSTTILKFAPTELLNTEQKYFVIIKGDTALDNTSGVLNFWEIGMNDTAKDTYTFNGIIYKGAHIWSFTTIKEQNENKGVCEIDHVSISPPSYLFNKTTEDINENDKDPEDDDFDIAQDNDKVFTADAISSDGQILIPVDGYKWEWKWDIGNKAVIDIVPGIYTDDKDIKKSQLVEAKPMIVDKATYLEVEVDLIEDEYSKVGAGASTTADIQVFICENPWPPIGQNGTWKSWEDDITNCIGDSGTCYDTNYLMYYCRDAGGAGTQDDLPAIFSNAVTRGKTDDIIKESFFFREGVPEIKGEKRLSGTIVEGGGAVDLEWDGVADVLKYKVYYEREKSWTTVELDKYQDIVKFRLAGLTNGTEYFITVTAISEDNVESDYSNEIVLTPVDEIAPSTPVKFKIDYSSTSTIEASWNISPSTSGYNVYYGLVDGAPAKKKTVTNPRIEIDFGDASGKYYFTVTAFDLAGNESEKTESKSITLPKPKE